jgi:hypothetical protein
MKSLAFERKLNLLVGFPSIGQWTGGFGVCLTNMLSYLMSTPVPGFRTHSIIPLQVKGSILPRGRMNLVKEARARQCHKLLMIDTDQTFPKDTAHRLLQHGKDVIGCNIATKQYPASPTARKKGERWDGELVYTDPDSPPIEQVWRIGAGILLLDVRVFEKIGLGCFEIKWRPELEDYQGEDWSLCEALERAGIEIWVDHRLSNEVGHLGEFEYTHEFVGEKKLVEIEQKIIGEA